MKPLTTTNFALANLRRKPLRSIGLAAVVAVFSFTMLGGTMLSESLKKGMDSMADRLGADILVVPHGYEKKIQSALLRGEPSTFRIKEDLTDKIRLLPDVERAAPQLCLATLNAACCTVPSCGRWRTGSWRSSSTPMKAAVRNAGRVVEMTGGRMMELAQMGGTA